MVYYYYHYYISRWREFVHCTVHIFNFVFSGVTFCHCLIMDDFLSPEDEFEMMHAAEMEIMREMEDHCKYTTGKPWLVQLMWPVQAWY